MCVRALSYTFAANSTIYISVSSFNSEITINILSFHLYYAIFPSKSILIPKCSHVHSKDHTNRFQLCCSFNSWFAVIHTQHWNSDMELIADYTARLVATTRLIATAPVTDKRHRLLNSDNQRVRTFPLPCRAILIALTGHSCSRWWCVVLYQLHTTSRQYVPYHIHIICTWAHVARKEGMVVARQLPAWNHSSNWHLNICRDHWIFFTMCQYIFHMF